MFYLLLFFLYLLHFFREGVRTLPQNSESATTTHDSLGESVSAIRETQLFVYVNSVCSMNSFHETFFSKEH